MKKFELTNKTITVAGRTLHRIKALRSFGFVKAGELGGFVEKEENLSHDGLCWVSGNAKVFENAWVFGDAKVYGNAKVFEDAWVSGDAKVFEDAWVCGDAEVFEDAKVSGNAKVFEDAKVCRNTVLKETKTDEAVDTFEEIELTSDSKITVNQLKTGVVFVKDGKVMKKVKKQHVEMTIAELEKKLGIKNLKIVK